MSSLLLSNGLLYKEVKQYKNLENKRIGGELLNLKKLVLDQRYVSLNFENISSNNFFKIPYKLLHYKHFAKNKIIYYDKNLKKLVFNDIIYIWYHNEKFNITKPIQHTYLKSNYINNRYKDNKALFRKIEQKRNFLLLKKHKLYFLYNNIWFKIHKYNKNILKNFFILFIKKQNKLYLQQKINSDETTLNSILLGFHNKNIIIYIPALFKITIIPAKVINSKLNKIVLKNWKSLKKLNLSKQALKTNFYKYLIYNIFYKINIKKY